MTFIFLCSSPSQPQTTFKEEEEAAEVKLEADSECDSEPLDIRPENKDVFSENSLKIEFEVEEDNEENHQYENSFNILCQVALIIYIYVHK